MTRAAMATPRNGGHRSEHSPALRLTGPRGRVAHSRGVVLAAGLLARAGVLDALAAWPDARAPKLIVSPRNAHAARWLQRLVTPERHGPAARAPALWQALRARELVRASGPSPVVRAAERALARGIDRPSVALTSTNGGLGKITCFVFEHAAAEPCAVVKAMADPARGEWLAREVALLEAVRSRLGGSEAAAALPPAPILADAAGGDYLTVERLEAVAGDGRGFQQAAALRWLHAFIAATTEGARPWSAQDGGRVLEAAQRAWRLYRPGRAAAVTAALSRIVDSLEGVQLARCASHGDFWRGNVAGAPQLRVFDWEWAALASDPTVDHWTLELAELRPTAVERGTEARVQRALAEALERVEDRLAGHGVAPEFARMSLAPVLGWLTTRLGFVEGRTHGWQSAAPTLLAAAEPLIMAPGGG